MLGSDMDLFILCKRCLINIQSIYYMLIQRKIVFFSHLERGREGAEKELSEKSSQLFYLYFCIS
ncbi:unnamed protein product [Boreogadus saida]